MPVKVQQAHRKPTPPATNTVATALLPPAAAAALPGVKAAWMFFAIASAMGRFLRIRILRILHFALLLLLLLLLLLVVENAPLVDDALDGLAVLEFADD